MAEKEYIERGALIRRLQASPLGARDASGRFIKTGIIDLVKRQPNADVVEVRHGRWKIYDDGCGCELMHCSICKEEFYDGDNDTVDNLYNYCPNCGAKMDGKGEGE